MPVIIRDVDRIAATIIMVDSNLQRENILPSERAKAYKMKLDAIKQQGARYDLTSVQPGQKLVRKSSRDLIAENSPDSSTQIQRYIRLTELEPQLLQMVDEGKIGMTPAVELSYLMYAQMADHTAKQITGSFGEWTAFLETAGRLYKYPFHEQLMIFAQKPDATACADYDLWNKQMRRYVRRGTKGIALIDTSGDNPRLKYVFDVSDTGGRENSRRPFLWEYRDEHQDAVTAALEQRYDISGKQGLANQLEQIAFQLVNEYWNDNSHDILGILADSFLEEYDDYNVSLQSADRRV